MGSNNGTIENRKSKIANGAKRQVTLYPSRRMVTIAPGVKTAPLAKEHVPELAIVKWRAIGDGTFQPIIVVHETDIRVSTAAKVLGIDYKTLLRLIRAGFIESTQPAPRWLHMSLSSWFAHIERVRKDPEFWSRKENMRRYREAL